MEMLWKSAFVVMDFSLTVTKPFMAETLPVSLFGLCASPSICSRTKRVIGVLRDPSRHAGANGEIESYHQWIAVETQLRKTWLYVAGSMTLVEVSSSTQ